MARSCGQCGCVEFATSGEGSIVCTQCGTIVESSNIVSEIQFTEGSTVVGTFVGSRPSRYRSLGRDSRELSVENAKRRIEEIAAPLRIRPHHIESALRSFELALENGFTKGRRTRLVGAACLYAVCRREQTPHLLIDFSEILQVNVFVLANTFLQLIQTLNIRLPIVDPSIFIQRFSQSLEFAEKTGAVVTTANKIVQRMKRDWLSTGRKPSGICGAALYMASKIHGFKRSLKEIIHVVKVGEITLIKRLGEFQKTPAATLKMHEFDSMDIEQERDPPSFIANRQREVRKRLKELKRLKAIKEQEQDEEMIDLEEDLKLGKSRKRKLIKSKIDKEDELKEESTDLKTNDIEKTYKELNDEEDEILGDLLKEAQDQLKENKDIINQFEKSKKNTTTQDNEEEEEEEEEEKNTQTSSKSSQIKKNSEQSSLGSVMDIKKKEYIPSELDTDEGLKAFLEEPMISLEDSNIAEYPLLPEEENKEVDDSVFEPTDDLEGLDDLIEDYIESDKQVIASKDKIWSHEYRDWIELEEQRKKELEEDLAAGRPPRRRRATPSSKKAAENIAKNQADELKRQIRNSKLIEKFGLTFKGIFDPKSQGTSGESQPESSQGPSPQKPTSSLSKIQATRQQQQEEDTGGSLLSQRYRDYQDDDYYED